MKQVQISEELFLSLMKYHVLEYDSDKEKIIKGLQQKFDSLLNRELYTKYKTALSEEEREKARQNSF